MDILEKVAFLREILEKDRWKIEIEISEEARKFLRKNPWAPFIGALVDEQIKAKHAWELPKWLYDKLGDLNADIILTSDIRKLLFEYASEKLGVSKKKGENWASRVSDYIVDSVKALRNVKKDPVTMFENREYSSVEIYYLLRRFKGIGPKKAKMIIRDLIYSQKYENYENSFWYDQIKAVRPNFKVKDCKVLDIPVDTHVKRVFARFVLGLKGVDSRISSEDIIMLARLVYPELPVRLDEIFWNIGKDFCKTKPRCEKCPLKEKCELYARLIH